MLTQLCAGPQVHFAHASKCYSRDADGCNGGRDADGLNGSVRVGDAGDPVSEIGCVTGSDGGNCGNGHSCVVDGDDDDGCGGDGDGGFDSGDGGDCCISEDGGGGSHGGGQVARRRRWATASRVQVRPAC
jgi:hypothetical protein